MMIVISVKNIELMLQLVIVKMDIMKLNTFVYNVIINVLLVLML